MPARKHDETRFPHAPDVLERETSDGGFSAGYGLHHPPTESYILDCHTHMQTKSLAVMKRSANRFFERGGAMRVRRLVFMDGKPNNIQLFGKLSAADDRCLWMVWPEYNQPDLKFLTKAAKLRGFCGMKLHNHKLIQAADKPEQWLSKAWGAMLAFCGQQGQPILWHVTQRLTDCPYTGGGRNSYWKDGWPKGAKYTNQDLLDIFLDCVSRHRRTAFIGAHHLHLGPEKLGALFKQHPNLYADYSCGNIVRLGDSICDDDRERWRRHFIRWQDRLMFGTDCSFGGDVGDWYNWENAAAHIRFVHQLRLPKDVLEKVTHGNFERVALQGAVETKFAPWSGTRP